MICNKWDVVVVPFPFTDSSKAKQRPALVLSSKTFNSKNNHTTLAMITTAAKTKWFNDVEIKDLQAIGLSAASVIRYKIFTIDNRLIKKAIGKLSPVDQKACSKTFKEVFPD